MHVAIVVIISNSVSEGSPFSDRLIRFGQEHGGHLACVLLELEENHYACWGFLGMLEVHTLLDRLT